jgi:hypothetical protein
MTKQSHKNSDYSDTAVTKQMTLERSFLMLDSSSRGTKKIRH